MALEPQKILIISEIADILYPFLPANPYPYANQDISFPGCAKQVGIDYLWTGGSKRPAITQLLTNTLAQRQDKFCPLILAIVNTAIIYRTNKQNPIQKDEIVNLNQKIKDIGFKIPELWNPDFLNSLSSTKNQQVQPQNEDVINRLKEEYIQLSSLEPQKRGYAFQNFLKDFFEAYGLDPRSAFRLRGEELDGSFELNDTTYLVEAKWHGNQISEADLLVFKGKVDGKATWSRGLFISYTGFTKPGLEAFARGKSTNIIGMDAQDIYFILDGKMTLNEAIRRKARRAVEKNDFFVSVYELID